MGPHVFPAHTVQEAYELVLAEDLVADMLLADAYLLNQRSTLFMGEFLAAKTVPRFTWILLITSRRGPSRGFGGRRFGGRRFGGRRFGGRRFGVVT